ncbi:hypothetical protein JMM81_19905 [Bacillus sp. V3B]|uniref:TcaA NTF2-like domain-containing protein n=1 Tax=Bacillus sp. V3B TaxID=2804915 RepID=UPI00210D1698|nr:hypothetical protein [Bacillus sp. V3B]MCQ6277143.1 hypothetical protein [Bacillus sp. V3B]
MINSSLREKLLKWRDWEIKRGSQVAQEVDKFIQQLSQPYDIFWTGEAVQSSLLLDTLLSVDLFAKIGPEVGGIKFHIQYGLKKAFKAFFQNGQPRIINDQAFQLLLTEKDGPWKKARNQLKEIVMTLPNDVLRSTSIVYSPWSQHEKLMTVPNLSKYPWAVIAIGDQPLSGNQLTYIRSILEQPRIHTWVEGSHPFLENEYTYEAISIEQLSIISDALRENQNLSSYQANLFYDLISQPMTKLYDEIYPFYENTIDPMHHEVQRFLLQEEQWKESQKKHHQWMDAHHQFREILREWNTLKIKDMDSLTKALEEIGSFANKIGARENYVELLEEWDQFVCPQYKAYHRSFSTYFQNAKKHREELVSLSSRWPSVKKPFIFFSKLEDYYFDVEECNENGARLNGEANRIENAQKEMRDTFQRFQVKVKGLLQKLDAVLLWKMKTQHQRYEQWLQRRLQNSRWNEEIINEVTMKVKMWKTSLGYINPLLQLYEYKDRAYFENTINLYENLQEITKTEQLEKGKKRLDGLYKKRKYPNLNESIDGPSIQLEQCTMNVKQYLSGRIKINLPSYIEKLRRRRNKVAAILVLGVTFWVGTAILGDENVYSYSYDEGSSQFDHQSYEHMEEDDVDVEGQVDLVAEEVSEPPIIFQVDEEGLTQFLDDFRNDYMSALNYRDFSRIAPYLFNQGYAYSELANYILSLTDNGYYFEFYHLSINGIENMGDNRYKVHVYETFDFTNSEGQVTFYEREKSYTIQALSETNFAIERIDITSTNKEEIATNEEGVEEAAVEEAIVEEVVVEDVVVVEDEVAPAITESEMLSFINRYYDDYVMAYNGEGFERVAWAYDLNSEEAQKVEADIQTVNEINLTMYNESLEIKGIEYNGDSYDVVVTFVDQYIEPDGSTNKEKFDGHYRVQAVDGSFIMEEFVGASYVYPEFNE